MRPVFEARQAEYASSGAAAERHDDFIQWIMDSYRADGKNFKAEEIVHNVFIVMFASMHGTSFIALQYLFSLIGTPGALAEIREEINRVSKDDLGKLPIWTRHALGELITLGSFMKETLRMTPFQEGKLLLYLLLLLLPIPLLVHKTSFSTYTTQLLSIGTPLPVTRIRTAFTSHPGPSYRSLNLRHNLDTNMVPNADTFDGKRWLRRRTGFDMSKFQFASMAEDAFDWGGSY